MRWTGAAITLGGAEARADTCTAEDFAGCDPTDPRVCLDYVGCSCNICVGELVCSNSRCVKVCTTAVDCDDTDLCVEGICRPPKCSSSADCDVGLVCSAAGGCEAPIDPGPDPSLACRASDRWVGRGARSGAMALFVVSLALLIRRRGAGVRRRS